MTYLIAPRLRDGETCDAGERKSVWPFVAGALNSGTKGPSVFGSEEFESW